MKRPTQRLLAIVTAVLAWQAVPAAERVVFQDGRAMTVQSVEEGPEGVELVLDGGGRLVVPAARVARVELLEPARTVEEESSQESSFPPWVDRAGPYTELVAETAHRHDVDPALLAAMIQVESAFDPYAVSRKGACGMLQLLPATAERFGVEDVFDPEQNVEGGARYLRWLLDRFHGDTALALAGYNAGENAVKSHGGIPPYRETRDYVARVLQHVSRFRPGP